MSQSKAIKSATLELIRSLQEKKYLEGFYLVGGTALALYLNHRKSDDIDLFINTDFDAASLFEKIGHDFQYQLFYSAANTLKGSIGDVKVDFLAHRYPYLYKQQTVDGILMISEQDIIAMKLNAISTSGQRSKDFIDIYYLLGRYDIGSMINFYRSKYSQENEAIILKSLIYFDDVDMADWPVLLTDRDLQWEDVKIKIEEAVMRFLKSNHS